MQATVQCARSHGDCQWRNRPTTYAGPLPQRPIRAQPAAFTTDRRQRCTFASPSVKDNPKNPTAWHCEKVTNSNSNVFQPHIELHYSPMYCRGSHLHRLHMHISNHKAANSSTTIKPSVAQRPERPVIGALIIRTLVQPRNGIKTCALTIKVPLVKLTVLSFICFYQIHLLTLWSIQSTNCLRLFFCNYLQDSIHRQIGCMTHRHIHYETSDLPRDR